MLFLQCLSAGLELRDTMKPSATQLVVMKCSGEKFTHANEWSMCGWRMKCGGTNNICRYRLPGKSFHMQMNGVCVAGE